jgi:replicative DNA helicase
MKRIEKLVLGACFYDNNYARSILLSCQVKDFTADIAKTLFETIKVVMSEFGQVTPSLVSERLFAELISSEELADYAMDYKKSCETIDSLIRELKDGRVKSLMASIIKQVTNELEENATLSGFALYERLQRALSKLESITKLKAHSLITIDSVVDQVLKDLQNIQNGIDLSVSTGIATVDSQLSQGGYARGELTVVGALRSIGKTTFMLESFRHCIKNNICAVFFTLEMLPSSLLGRLLLNDTGGSKLTNALRDNAEAMISLRESVEAYRGKKVFIENKTDLSDIISWVDNAIELYDIKAVYIDYGGLLENRNDKENKSEYLRIDAKYRTLKREIAMKHKIAVIVAEQGDSQDEGKAGQPPKLKFKGSGGIADEADTAIQLWGQRDSQDVGCIISKQRLGEVSKPFYLRFDKKIQKFYDGQRSLAVDSKTLQEIALKK